MKKKILTVVAALAIMTVGTTAFAAGSPAAGETEVVEDTTQAASYEAVEVPADTVEDMAAATSVDTGDDSLVIDSVAVADATVSEAATAATNIIANLATLAEDLDNEDLADAATDDTKKVTATLAAVVNLEVTEGEIPEGGVTITINNEAIEADGIYAVLHYTGSAWETIPATDIQAGSLKITVTSLSPVAIVKVEVVDNDAEVDGNEDPSEENPDDETGVEDPDDETGVEDPDDETGDDESGDDESGDDESGDDESGEDISDVDTDDTSASASATTAAATTESSSSTGTSPKTGETTPVAVFALLACVAGAFACSKKSQKK
jgi:hypothetical protein